MDALLEIADIEYSYGPLQVLFGVSLAVPPEARIALLGTNGAGKSTLLKIAAGLLRPDRGRVSLDGEDVTHLRAEERVSRGLTLIEGGRAIFPSVSVEDNIRLGAYHLPSRSPEVSERLQAALELFGALRPKLDQAAGTLSGGEQQMVALARAIMAKPRLLLIDELSLGLAPIVMAEIARAVDAMTEQGTTLLLVEQSLNVALALANEAYFMEKGEVRFSGPTADLLERGDLVRSVFFGPQEAAVG